MPAGASLIAQLAAKSQTRLSDQHFHFQCQPKWFNMIAPATPTKKHQLCVFSARCTHQSREPTFTYRHMHKKIPLLWEMRGWCWGTHRRVSTPNPSSCFSAQSSPYQHGPQGTNPVPTGHPEEMLINLPPPAQVLRRRPETSPHQPS